MTLRRRRATTTSTSPSSCADRRASRRSASGRARRLDRPPRRRLRGAVRHANLGDHVGDDARRRRREPAPARARRSGSADPTAWVWLAPGARRDGRRRRRRPRRRRRRRRPTPRSPTTPGLPLVVLTADCAPIALASDDAVGVVHAGWPGLLAGVVEAAVAALRARRARAGARRARAVHPPGALRVRRAPTSTGWSRGSARRSRPRTADGRPALDLPAAVRAALGRVGVDDVDDVGVCTARVARPLLLPARRHDRAPGARRGARAVSDAAVDVDRDVAARRRGRCGRGSRPRPRRARARPGVGHARRGDQDGRAGARRAPRSAPACIDLGENRAQELLAKAPALAARPAPPRWHFLGALQRNKVQRARAVGHVLAVGRPASSSARRSPGTRPARRVLVEVNLGGRAAEGRLRARRRRARSSTRSRGARPRRRRA